MSDIKGLFETFKDDLEKQEYLEKQQKVITSLLKKNVQLTEEVNHLRELLTSTTQLLPAEQKVERIIVTLEEGLIDKQIQLIQARGISSELTLEDTKKLDLLLKNKNIIKESAKAIEVQPKKLDKSTLTNAQLLQIVSTKKPDGKE